MDYLNLLSNATVLDQDSDVVGEVMGFSITGNRMHIKIVVMEGYSDDPDDGSREPVVEFTPDTDAVAPLPDLKLVEGARG